MRIKNVLLVALGIGVTTSGCAQETTDEGYGSASVAALTSSEVDRVEITVDGTGFAATLARDGVSGNFEPVVIPDIPIGAYTFRAEAYDDAVPVTPVLLYSGTAAVTITEGIETAVTIVLQQVPPVDPFNNTVPIFQSLVYTPANPRTDEVVTLTVSVIDPDVGDVVTLLWSAPGGGTLVPPLDQASVDWTAPSTAGSFAVTVTATDSTGATASLTATLGVELRLGSSEVSIDLNTWPEVSNLVPVPTRIDVGESTSLTLSATDPDGDDLAYAWSATGCLGTFSDATVASPNFTLTDAQGNTECTLSVNITDVDTVTALPRGGANTAELTIATGPEVVPGPGAPPAATCPCWDGSPGSAGSSLQDVWATLAPANCLYLDSCSDNGDPSDYTSWATCRDDLGTQLQTSAQLTPFVSISACFVRETFWPPSGGSQTGTGLDVTFTGITAEQNAACRAEHDAFTSTTDFGGFENDPICGLPIPGSTPAGVACAGSAPGLVLAGTDYAGGGTLLDPNIVPQACVDEVGLLYLDNGCPLQPSSQRRSACDSALNTSACQSCDNTGSQGACTACNTELENRFNPACLGGGFPVCE